MSWRVLSSIGALSGAIAALTARLDIPRETPQKNRIAALRDTTDQ